MSYKWVLINPSNIQHFTRKNKSQSYIIISWHLELSLYPCCSVLYFCSFITDFQLTHWLLWDLDSILKVLSSILFYWLVCSDLLMIMPSEWLRWMSWDLPEDKSTLVQVLWLGAVRQLAITWANVDPDLRIKRTGSRVTWLGLPVPNHVLLNSGILIKYTFFYVWSVRDTLWYNC